MESLECFGQRLKALRAERGGTQKALGALLSCSTSNDQKIEYGQVNIPITSLYLLADHFQVSADYLLGRSDTK